MKQLPIDPAQPPQSDKPAEPRAPSAPPRISSEQLFGEGTEVQIEHRGALYRLRMTALGKLILTK
jgi:hemin uptake protein HemP